MGQPSHNRANILYPTNFAHKNIYSFNTLTRERGQKGEFESAWFINICKILRNRDFSFGFISVRRFKVATQNGTTPPRMARLHQEWRNSPPPE